MGLLQEISSEEKKPTRPTTAPLIEPPGKPRGVVAGTAMATAESEKISCRHFRTKKILLVGNDSMGALNWGDVEIAIQCTECACILRESCPQ
jgi:hypothetical protein